VKNFGLSSDSDHLDYKSSAKEMCLAKSYAAHISYVTQLEYDHKKKYLFSTGLSDECVMKWNLQMERPLWDYDNLDYEAIYESTIEFRNQAVLAEIVSED
jgi:hypothetical protein